ncbi:MAG: mevalonate kinase [Deltaproteobacteria bacterium]|nr:mevalonate kinase [Deltaproteobacteria bacterium]
MWTEQACGKVILLGEHAVVYDQPALAAGLSRGAEATFTPSKNADEVTLDLEDLVMGITRSGDTDLARALGAALDALSALGATEKLTGHVRAKLLLPPGGGVGSSAALGVAVARALAHGALGRALTSQEAVQCATAWEKVFHGTPSGLDHTAAVYGGVGLFTRAGGWKPMRISSPLRVLFADTGERTPTKETVGNVAKLRERRPIVVDGACESIGILVRNAALALESGDLKGLGQLMDLNQNLLAGLMVSTERTETLCRVARDHGALGAKLTGGGGGGCVIAITHEGDEARVLDAWRAEGAPVFEATIACE